jgi:hypothetical protein
LLHTDCDDVQGLTREHAPSSFHQHHVAKMNVLLLLSLLFFIPIGLLVVFLALSSCMGDSFRASLAGIPVTFNPRNATFGRQYTRGFGSGAGSAGWEQIEMEDMMGEDSDQDY